ncbi:hypothetical protein BS78_05G195100 [Paspalum vaginatum]|nr:hypothetical protein BS78_05G195100 [Paspalum vaginatum]
MSDYHPNQRDEIRRKYLLWGPCQPRTYEFPYRIIAKKKRRFNPDWFDQYANWLEYSEKEDKAYCLCCYLDNNIDTQHGHDAFVIQGWNSWKNSERLGLHVGDRTSFHNKALKECEDLLKKDQSISASMKKRSQVEKIEGSIRLNAAIDVCRYLLHQGHSFRGHDESKESENRGNYLEMMEYTCKQNSVIAKAFKFAPLNNQLVSPKIQKDITQCFAKEILRSFIEEIDHDVFSLLVDESRDVSDKEQMATVLRYVDKSGLVKEKIVGVIHVEETTAAYLKSCVDTLLAELGLSLKQIRGQGYDGASNMAEEDGTDDSKKRQASGLLKYFQTFNFAFFLQMMMEILALTNGLSKILQKKDKDIVNAISDVASTKRELEKLRSNDGWDSLIHKVCSFCEKHDIQVIEMEKDYVNPKKPRQRTSINNEHHYRIDCFFAVLDLLQKEFNDRFNEVNSELLSCMSALSPENSFHNFNAEKLLHLAKFYPTDFNYKAVETLERELRLYIDNVLHDSDFGNLQTISALARQMVESKRHLSYPLVYRLVKLALTLSVATATVERCFLAMKIVKNVLRNKIGDEYMSHSLICFVEKDMLNKIPNEVIVDAFYKMKDRMDKKHEV